MNDLRRAALRLEMAEGRVQALRQGGVEGDLSDAMFDLESHRNQFRLAVHEATGLDPQTLARLLAI